MALRIMIALLYLKHARPIELIIGHLKSDHCMDCCHLKGALGDSLHAVLCAAGYNIHRLLRLIVSKAGWPCCGAFAFICACATGCRPIAKLASGTVQSRHRHVQ